VQQRTMRILIGIILLAVIVGWIDQPATLLINTLGINREIKTHEGLDLQGGMQVMLEADVPPGTPVSADSMQAAKGVIENLINGLGVSEPLIQQQGDRRIIVELPGVKDPDMAIKTFGQTGLLEFIDAGTTYLPPGTEVQTTGFTEPTSAAPAATPAPVGTPGTAATPAAAATPAPTVASAAATPDAATTPAAAATPTAAATPGAGSSTPSATGTVTDTGTVTGTTTTPATPAAPVYTTVMTGKHLSSAEVGFNQTSQPQINFKMTSEGAKLLGDYSSTHVGQYMAIVMDGKVISCPVINSAITGGDGIIEGKFTLPEVQSLVIQLKYGALPIPLKVVENRNVGATLGEDSVNRSLLAGIIGLGIVIFFMIVYYRVPGVLADIALLIYAATVFALFKLIPITLTVPGIAGFILSIGMAVDANILIFERTREELRAGKTLGAAIEAGFNRAWTSIRDSNISTLITCAILFWFGTNYGASIIKGFALTLGLGVVISMFTAIVVTRTFLRVLVSSGIIKDRRLFAIVDEKGA
jgi:preprotein translocase subunit SecD